MKKEILVIGGGGYVGSPLCERLSQSGYQITSLDTFWFGNFHSRKINAIKWNLLKIKAEGLPLDLDSFDTVIFLACISNDPSSELDQSFTKKVNYEAVTKVLELIEASTIKRLIYASSSSVYGIKDELEVTEQLTTKPLTLYSQLKLEVENFIKNNFNSTDSVIIRPATVYGPSPRMRLDVVVNLFCAHAFFNQKLKIFGGSQYRPNLYIEDMIALYELLVKAEGHFGHEVYNYGGPNFTVEEIAQKVKSLCPLEVELETIKSDDNRSYRINSSKAKEAFGISPSRSLEEGIRQNFKLFETWDKGKWTQAQHTNLQQMKILIQNKEHFL